MTAAPKLQMVKDLYSVGEIPPLGHVPDKMHAWAIRQDRHGPPLELDADRGSADLADR